MKTTNQQTQNSQALTDFYYDQVQGNNNGQPSNVIANYDSCVDYMNDTWSFTPSTTEVMDMQRNLEEFMEGETELLPNFALYIARNMMNLMERLPEHFEARNTLALNDLKHTVKPTLEMVGEHDLINELNDLVNDWRRNKIDQSKVQKIIDKAKYIKNLLHTIASDFNRKAA